jgi:L-2-hydroxyglutarate oxidase LhgO
MSLPNGRTPAQLTFTMNEYDLESSASHSKNYDVLVIGAGIIGLTIALKLLEQNQYARVVVIEKETNAGLHASGRNSGVIHSGFYYSADSLKSKFCRDGNQMMISMLEESRLPFKRTGKILVCRNELDIFRLHSLKEKAELNGVKVEILPASELVNYEPLARTYQNFLWSPNTAIASPMTFTNLILKKFLALGGEIIFDCEVKDLKVDSVITTQDIRIGFKTCINASGTGALALAQLDGIGHEYGLIPVIGGYLSTSFSNLPLRTLVYSVPYPESPFLGIHFTLTMDDRVRIGPSATPVLGNAQYRLMSKITIKEAMSSVGSMAAIILKDKDSAVTSFLKQFTRTLKSQMIKEGKELVSDLPNSKLWNRDRAGIRAQLIEKSNGKLVQDFIIKKSGNHIHILNAVSPGWTSALTFADYLMKEYQL